MNKTFFNLTRIPFQSLASNKKGDLYGLIIQDLEEQFPYGIYHISTNPDKQDVTLTSTDNGRYRNMTMSATKDSILFPVDDGGSKIGAIDSDDKLSWFNGDLQNIHPILNMTSIPSSGATGAFDGLCLLAFVNSFIPSLAFYNPGSGSFDSVPLPKEISHAETLLNSKLKVIDDYYIYVITPSFLCRYFILQKTWQVWSSINTGQQNSHVYSFNDITSSVVSNRETLFLTASLQNGRSSMLYSNDNAKTWQQLPLVEDMSSLALHAHGNYIYSFNHKKDSSIFVFNTKNAKHAVFNDIGDAYPEGNIGLNNFTINEAVGNIYVPTTKGVVYASIKEIEEQVG